MALQYTSSGSLACTSFNSLANSTTTGAASSAAATTSTANNVVDALVRLRISVGAITPSASTNIIIYCYGSEDGTNFEGPTTGATERLAGTDSAITLGSSSNNLRFLGTINCHTASLIYDKMFNIAAAFGGTLPRKWAIVIQNQTGVALASSGHSINYTEVYYN